MYFHKPVIFQEDITNILLLFFDKSFNILKIENLGGIPNNNYRVVFDSLEVALKIYSLGQSSLKHVDEEVRFIRFMQSAGVNTLTLIPGINSDYIQFWKGFPVVCSYYISGEVLSNISIDNLLAQKVGSYVADFSNNASLFQTNILPTDNLCSTIEYVFHDIDRNKLSQVILNDMDYIISMWQSIKNSIISMNKQYAPQMVHMDLWPYNLILSDNKLFSVDYDDWMYTTPIFELAVILLEFCMFKTDIFNWSIAEHLLHAFYGISKKKYKSTDILLAMKYLCILWYGYNLVESINYSDAKIYVKKLSTITTANFSNTFCDFFKDGGEL